MNPRGDGGGRCCAAGAAWPDRRAGSLLQQALRICDSRTDIEQVERNRYKDFFSCINKLSVTTSGLWLKGVFSSMMKQSVRRGAEEGIEMDPKTPPLYPMRHTANIVRAYYTLGDRQV